LYLEVLDQFAYFHSLDHIKADCYLIFDRILQLGVKEFFYKDNVKAIKSKIEQKLKQNLASIFAKHSQKRAIIRKTTLHESLNKEAMANPWSSRKKNTISIDKYGELQIEGGYQDILNT